MLPILSVKFHVINSWESISKRISIEAASKLFEHTYTLDKSIGNRKKDKINYEVHGSSIKPYARNPIGFSPLFMAVRYFNTANYFTKPFYLEALLVSRLLYLPMETPILWKFWLLLKLYKIKICLNCFPKNPPLAHHIFSPGETQNICNLINDSSLRQICSCVVPASCWYLAILLLKSEGDFFQQGIT